MRYHHLEGAIQKRPSKQRWIFGIPFVMVIVGAYALATVNAPLLQGIDGRSPQATAEKLLSVKPGNEGDRLYIPQINIDVPIMAGDDVSALASGAWHRQQGQSQGNPEKGGTFVLGARSLKVGLTPNETKAQSPFYHLDELQTGDELFVDWKGERYVYQVKKRVMVETVQEIFDKALLEEVPALTLYTANEQGDMENDVAIRAEKVGVVAWGPKPVIQRDDNQAN